jgi:hypothetical protein
MDFLAKLFKDTLPQNLGAAGIAIYVIRELALAGKADPYTVLSIGIVTAAFIISRGITSRAAVGAPPETTVTTNVTGGVVSVAEQPK